MKKVPLALVLFVAPAFAQQTAPVPAVEDATQQLVNRIIADRDRYMVEAANAVAENARLKREIEELKKKLPQEDKK